MTSPQLGLLPAGGDDRLPALTAAQLASRGGFQLCQRVRTEIGERMALELGPEVFDGIEVRRIAGQQRHLHGAACAVETVACDPALVLGRAVPDDQELSLEPPAQGLQELHELRCFDRPDVESEQEIRARQEDRQLKAVTIENERASSASSFSKLRGLTRCSSKPTFRASSISAF